MIFGVPINLSTVWYSASKIKARGVDIPKQSSPRDLMGYKEVVSGGVFLPYGYPSCEILGPYVFIIIRGERSRMGSKELGQAYDKQYKVMLNMSYSLGGTGGGLWDSTHGGHNDIWGSNKFEHSLVFSVKN